ncbi:hypothetical protein [Sphingomonas sp.]
MNFGLFPMLKRFKDVRHDWEPRMLEGTRDIVCRTPTATSNMSSAR